QNARNKDNHTTKKGIFNTPWFAFLIICCIKSTSLNPDANSSRVPQGSAAAAVTNARGVAIDAHDADHCADVRGRSEPAPLQTADGCIPEPEPFQTARTTAPRKVRVADGCTGANC